ncbi:MAG TPA: ABC transporter ATP-binding protein [Mycobacteriales bacterium]|nr:ABC transporter ATP-binding protein [Mycobacteriales bacterium]
MLELFRWGYAEARKLTVVLLTLVVLDSLAMVALTVLVGQVVGAADGLSNGGPVGRFVGLIAALAVVFLIDTTVPVLRAACMTRLETHMARVAVTQIADPLLAPRRAGHIDDPKVQDAFGRCTTEIQIPIDVGPTVASFQLASRLTLVGSLVVLTVVFHWWVAVAMLAGTVFLEWWWRRYIEAEIEVWHGRTEQQRHATYLFDLTVLHAAKEIRIFGLNRWLFRAQQRWMADALRPIARRRARNGSANLVASLLPVAITGGGIALAGLEAWRGQLSITAFATAVPALLAAASGFAAGSSAQVRRARHALREMRNLPALIEQRHPEPAGHSADLSRAPQQEIRFESVSFRYPGADRDVLSRLDLTIGAHEALAIVGVNGAGKSTLVKLLAGVYAPTGGRILVDGVDLAAIDGDSLASWQRRIATIVQDFLQLPLSARDNVSFGAVANATEDDAFIDTAVARAGARDVIDRLPAGWDTRLDKSYDGGVDLSGGEWQRIALARALRAVDAGASVLVLDEPAAALDVRSEAALVDRYLELTAGIASVIISHRFSVVRDADRICVLGDGRILESGRHQDLIASGGHYATMFALQASRYIEVDQP